MLGQRSSASGWQSWWEPRSLRRCPEASRQLRPPGLRQALPARERISLSSGVAGGREGVKGQRREDAVSSLAPPGPTETSPAWFRGMRWPLLHPPRWHSLPGPLSWLIRLALNSHCTPSPGAALICCTTASPFCNKFTVNRLIAK